MQTGKVIGIYIAGAAEELPHAVGAAHAVPNLGLEGDRYYAEVGTFSRSGRERGGRDVTLISSEALAAMTEEMGVMLDGAATRRNILTQGIDLEALIEREFRIGEVRLRGVRLCTPCTHLSALAGVDARTGLAGKRGGLRADILSEGTIRVGDALEEG